MAHSESPTTFSLQEELPPLPVPDLRDTCDKYLRSIIPFASEEEYKRTEKIVRDFTRDGGLGEKLHSIIRDRAAEHRNWLEEWWEYAAYLSWREPIVPNVNMICGFGSWTNFSIRVPQARRAAEIIRYSVEYAELLKKGLVPPETMMGRPMCMNMFDRIFSECRRPGEEADTLEKYPWREVQHVMVICRGCQFFLKVYYDEKRILTIGDLERQILRIQSHADYLHRQGLQDKEFGKENRNDDDSRIHCVPQAGIGAFTSGKRREWALARQELADMDPRNENHLTKVESSLFSVTLESEDLATDREQTLHAVAGGPAKDRWFDKSFQYIVFPNGMVGCNLEHANADATIYLSMFTWCGERYLHRGGIDTYIESRTHEYLPEPEVAKWYVTASLVRRVNLAEEDFCERTKDLDCQVDRMRLGKKWIKSLKMPPDTTVQLAVQLAYYRIHGKVAPTYESAHTRFFYHGRTETIRSCGVEVVEWVKRMDDPNTSGDTKRKLLHEAVQSHMTLGRDALSANGVDRLLLGMQIAAYLSGEEVPELYKDPMYTKSGGGGNYVLSTSNVSGKGQMGANRFLWGGFLPMVPHGIGVCYSLRSEESAFLVTTYRSTATVDSKTFLRTLFDSIKAIEALLTEGEESSKAQALSKL